MKTVLRIMTARMEKLNQRDSTRSKANRRNRLPLAAISSLSSSLQHQRICVNERKGFYSVHRFKVKD